MAVSGLSEHGGMTTMQPTIPSICASALGRAPQHRRRFVSKGFLNLTLATALGASATYALPLAAVAGPSVEFDVARAVECRDVTPRERILQYPTQRLVEVELPVSVRFNEVARGDVDEIDIEVSGATAGLRVQDFAPATQLAS